MSDKAIKWRGQEWEEIPCGTIRNACGHCYSPKMLPGERIIHVRPVPKPLREWWLVVGPEMSHHPVVYQNKEHAYSAAINMSDICGKSYDVIHMREVWEEGK